MRLPPGTCLGPYEILAPIGAGGMGEVYRGHDTRLGRHVAIKVFPKHIAARPSSRRRFEREAKIMAALNHPHICQIFDVGHQEAVEYLVMEYVEGETLAQRLKRGPLPLDRMLRYGIQIAEALDRAHRREVIHRDLKPANIMLTKDGVKVLDFGLSKTRESSSTPASDDPSAFYPDLPFNRRHRHRRYSPLYRAGAA